jgi:hypothetical protein
MDLPIVYEVRVGIRIKVRRKVRYSDRVKVNV